MQQHTVIPGQPNMAVGQGNMVVQPNIVAGQQVRIGDQQYVIQPGQQIVIVNNTTTASKELQMKMYNSSRARTLGYVQIAMGVLAILFNMGLGLIDHNTIWEIGAGWWGSPFMIVAGLLGIASAKYRTRSLIRATLGLSILAALVAIPLLTQTGLGITQPWHCCQHNYNKTGNDALNALLIIVTLIETGAAIYQSILCCYATCDCCHEIAMVEAQMNAQNATGQPGQQAAYYNNGMTHSAQQAQMPQHQQQFGQQNVVAQQHHYPPQQFATQDHYVPQGMMLPSEAAGGAAVAEMPPSYEDSNNQSDHKVGLD